MGISRVLTAAAALLGFVAPILAQAQDVVRPRTYPTALYADDPQATASASVWDPAAFEPEAIAASYAGEPDALDVDLPMTLHPDVRDPLTDPRYESYELIVMVRRTPLRRQGEMILPGPAVRVYSRSRGGLIAHWRASTARGGKITPAGHFTPTGFSSGHRSSRYRNFPMNWAVFFRGHYAIHGVPDKYAKKLGRNVSAGCVRLEWRRARRLFHLIGQAGVGHVERLDRWSGAPRRDRSGAPRVRVGYRTLIVVE